MKLISLFTLSVLILGCSSNEGINVENPIEIAPIEIVEEFEETVVESTPEFTFLLPNIDSLKAQNARENYRESLSYIYLRESYGLNGERENEIVSQWDSSSVCGYEQKFHHQIKYRTTSCGEGGQSELILFPKVETSELKELINNLFLTEDNTWVSETSYEADGAGCYYTIIQDSDSTKLEIYCGC